MPNRLSKESSPYLLQHAENPVDWYPWGQEAFDKARAENKPILVSIGYSTCHWCHVMERESFENEDVAALMNEHFVNIKVDREERPDVDQIYMDAVQVLTGSGGWPLNCFLTPELKPFYGGTYFPPKPAYGRPSWPQLLNHMSNAFHNKRQEVEEQAERLLGFVREADERFLSDFGPEAGERPFNPVWATQVFHGIMESADKAEGGFGAAPKFPAAMSLRYLLDYHCHFKEDAALEHLHLSLRKMIFGGIYDQLRGGFARYSTDAEWLAPHFEKMLYDNALLASLLADAYSHTGENLYKETLEETLEWVLLEMRQEEGGFYSALDADSEGEEGKFYVWDAAEIHALLGDDAPLFSAFYDVSPQGNWEGKNILRRRMPAAEFAKKIGWGEAEFRGQLNRWKQRLLLERGKRTRPGLDDKVLLDWNALMCSAFCDAYRATQEEAYLEVARKNMDFLFGKMKKGDGFHHSYKEGRASHAAYLNDYAYLIQALLKLYQNTFDTAYLEKAAALADYVLLHFSAPENPYFYYTEAGRDDILVRKRDLYDNALPSGNAIMLGNLQRLSLLLGKSEYRGRAQAMLKGMRQSVERYPRSFSQWACEGLNEVFPAVETAVTGPQAISLARQINQRYLPHQLVMAAETPTTGYPLLEDRFGPENQIFRCSNFACRQAVNTVAEYWKDFDA